MDFSSQVKGKRKKEKKKFVLDEKENVDSETWLT